MIMEDVKTTSKSCHRTRGTSLPTPSKKDRAPSTCLFRGQDHSERLLEEFDNLRNLQGKSSLWRKASSLSSLN